MEWCWNYFTDEGHSGAGPPVETRGGEPRGGLCGDPVVVSRKPPLYFQHEGHSRTLVGVERRQPRPGAPAEVSLIILDPSQPTQPLLSALRERRHWQARPRLLHPTSALNGQHGRYQLVLLFFDRSFNGSPQWRRVKRQRGCPQGMVKRGLHTLRKAEYQVMYVVDGLAVDAELEQLKAMQATQKFG